MNPKPNFIELEHDILKFWEDNNCFQKRNEKNKNGPAFRFIDGPITANNNMGIHHAWGRTIKDTFLRYKAMNGYQSHYRNGFDTQGLWVEVEVEKELGFKSKKDIEAYGLDNFTRKCEERIHRCAGLITEQSKRLGQWMDWDNSYYTHVDENIGGIWHFLSVCNEKGWIAPENRPMPWCPRCGTSLSEHEMTGSYKEMTHNSVYFKVALDGTDFDLLVWTTTPWTLSANVALAVNPELDYYKLKIEGFERPVVMAKCAIGQVEGKKEVLCIMKGAELVGKTYESVFPELPIQQKIASAHRVVAWDEVASDDGSGVVHIAPGCGAEDFELGRSLGLPEPCPVDENGCFYDDYGFLSNLPAADVPQLVFDRLKELGKLFKILPFTHSYPVCWRCKTPVLFRLVREWYIKTEAAKPDLIRAANSVEWQPAYGGKRMVDWLENMGDWNISRKRFYGLPLPFYPCSCGHLTVIGSKAELRERAVDPAKVDALPELHRPWIDEVEIVCPCCGKPVHRVAEVGDVWLDAGIVPFSTLGYFSNREMWEKYWPADWITEMREQIRLWFYSMLFMSVTLTGKAPYKHALTYYSVVAEDGSKFSKTGFMIRFDEAAERLGADAIRYLYAGANINSDVRFGFNLGDEARRKLLGYWNICTFFDTYASLEKPDVTTPVDGASLTLSDRWMLARLDAAVKEITKHYEAFDSADVVHAFELLVDDVSNWYVRINRRRFWDNDRTAFAVLFKVIRVMTALIAPVIPFMTEHVWQNIVRPLDASAPISVHLEDFPKAEEIGGEDILEANALVRDVINMALKLRNEQQLKVKQPLRTMTVVSDDEKAAMLRNYADVICDEMNVKSLEFASDKSALESGFLTLNFRKAGAVLKGNVNKVKGMLEGSDAAAMAAMVAGFDAGTVNVPGWDEALPAELFIRNAKPKEGVILTEENGICVALDTVLDEALVNEGIYRELQRQCQVLRRDFGFRVEQHIRLSLNGEGKAIEVAKQYADSLRSECLADEVYFETRGYANTREITAGGETVTAEMEVVC